MPNLITTIYLGRYLNIKHIGGRYKGIQCSVFHLDHCYLYDTFGFKKTIKGFNFNDKNN